MAIMTKQLPDKFLMLTHEGLARVTIVQEPIYQIDQLISRFGSEKLVTVARVADHPHGTIHLAVRTGQPIWKMAVLELTAGSMVLSTEYKVITEGELETEQTWVSPVFGKDDTSFPLRCKFEFAIWARANLRMFLGAASNSTLNLWVYYEGQIYRPPFGNIFDTCQLCVGHNEGLLSKAFSYTQTYSETFNKAIQLMSDSPWNIDTFHHEELAYLQTLVRFDSNQKELPMLDPISPELIKKCKVAANKDLAEITAAIVTN